MFATLILCHLLGDFVFQTDRLVQFKLKSDWGIAIHVAIHVLMLILLIQGEAWLKWCLIGFIAITHFAIDWLKVHQPKVGGKETPGFWLDQAAHLFVIFLALPYIQQLQGVLPTSTLYFHLWAAAIPSLMVALWVGTMDVEEERPLTTYLSQNLLTYSKRFNICLWCTLTVSLLLV